MGDDVSEQKFPECWLVFLREEESSESGYVRSLFDSKSSADECISDVCRFVTSELTPVRMLPAVAVESAIRAAVGKLIESAEYADDMDGSRSDVTEAFRADAERLILDAINQEVTG